MDFYKSREWRELRYKALLAFGRKCLCCNSTDKALHVDHIKPISRYPHLKLDINNLQVLCEDCNLGKSNKDTSDFRFNGHDLNIVYKKLKESSALVDVVDNFSEKEKAFVYAYNHKKQNDQEISEGLYIEMCKIIASHKEFNLEA